MSPNTVETAANGRTVNGQFGLGNRFASGHKHRQHVAKLRRAFTEALTPDDIVELVTKLMELGKAGDVMAIRILLDRALGRVQSPAEFEGLDAELDAESDLQNVMRIILEREPGIPADMLQRKADMMLRVSRLSIEQQAEFADRLKEFRAAKDAAQASQENAA